MGGDTQKYSGKDVGGLRKTGPVFLGTNPNEGKYQALEKGRCKEDRSQGVEGQEEVTGRSVCLKINQEKGGVPGEKRRLG